ncbi:unnamed protein product [Meganyctiphanes norvegica]|uniref:Uncharacterized protein n=1 Tax=Meganyctiphanes norvegica TaxID=48144 RepID=A0AAV2R1B2_MEGNR
MSFVFANSNKGDACSVRQFPIELLLNIFLNESGLDCVIFFDVNMIFLSNVGSSESVYAGEVLLFLFKLESCKLLFKFIDLYTGKFPNSTDFNIGEVCVASVT